MVGLLDPTGGKILFVFFFKEQKDLEGRREHGFWNPTKVLFLKIYASLLANCPQAASMSLPRLRRTFTTIPIASSALM